MGTIVFLVGFPLIIALALLVVKADSLRDIIVKLSAIVIIVVSIVFVVMNFSSTMELVNMPYGETIGYGMMAIEVCLAVVIIVLSIKYKKPLAAVFAIIQTPLLIWFELTAGHHIEVANNICIDKLQMIMVLIIGIIGTLICVYAIGYMKDFQKHENEHVREEAKAAGLSEEEIEAAVAKADRRPWFFFLLFLFLAAMFGLVSSNNLIWMYFFWEITSLCSFFLIGFTKTQEAINNSFRALVMNLFGGLGFVLGIITLGSYYGTLELSTMLTIGSMGYSVVVPAAFLALAGITKAAQMPFQSWLLGAMVAPTPTSALLHSSTMVKAGVFLIIKLSPVLGFNWAGIMVMVVGGATFVMASFAAISQSNAKRVLAYSTVANLGLITACGGVGMAGATWAGIMLIIFHAVTKSLLFLCVGTAEHQIGSRNIEDMDGLFEKMPKLAKYMLIGIAGMFLAPFGMLIGKWATLVAFVDSGNILLIVAICFGSAATAFYWTKWMGKLSATMAGRENIQGRVHKEEDTSQIILVVLVVAACLGFPLVSSEMLIPHLGAIFGDVTALALSTNNMILMVIMLLAIVMLFAFYFGKTDKKIVPIYMAGVNEGDNLTFKGSMEKDVPVSLRNWYMDGIFGEKKMCLYGGIISVIGMVLAFTFIVAAMLGGGM